MEPTRESATPKADGSRDAGRSGVRVRALALELAVGVVAGLVVFALLLWALNAGFPDATGLGELVRVRGEPPTAVGPMPSDDVDAAPFAALAAVQRDVREKRATSVAWDVARSGDRIGDRHAVQTFAGSGASIVFDEGASLRLGENSLIVVRRPQRVAGSGGRRAAVLFMEGFLRGRLGGDPGHDLELEVVAGGGVVRAPSDGRENPEVALALDREAASLAVREGTAEVVWGDTTTVVPSGHVVSFDPEHPPGDPVPLPRPPILESPTSAERFVYRGAPPQVTFSWRPSEPADAFQLQIAQETGFERIVYDGRTPAPPFVHGNLPAGRYYWRVMALRGPFAGSPSEPFAFVIDQDRQPPTLTVDLPPGPVEGSSVPLRGSTEAGCRVFVGDVSVPVGADGRFSYDLPVRPGYNFIVVQAVDASGNTAFDKRTIVADIRETKEQP